MAHDTSQWTTLDPLRHMRTELALLKRGFSTGFQPISYSFNLLELDSTGFIDCFNGFYLPSTDFLKVHVLEQGGASQA